MVIILLVGVITQFTTGDHNGGDQHLKNPTEIQTPKSPIFHGIFPSSTGGVCFRNMSDVFFCGNLCCLVIG